MMNTDSFLVPADVGRILLIHHVLLLLLTGCLVWLWQSLRRLSREVKWLRSAQQEQGKK